MPNRKISSDIQERALYLLSSGWSTPQVVAALGVSKRTLARWHASFQQYGHIPRLTYLSGRRRKLTAKHLQDLQELLRANPSIYLEEVVEWFALHHDLPISITSIHDALKGLGFTYKKLRRHAAERNELTRQQWKYDITSRFMASQLVFADESSKDNRTVLRRYGRAPAGERAVEVVSADRGVRYSILPALSVTGILTVRVVRGSVDGVTFLDWVINDLVCSLRLLNIRLFTMLAIKLPKMNPFPGPNSVLIVDNCRTHKSQAVRDVVEAAGMFTLYLPSTHPSARSSRMSVHISAAVLPRSQPY